MFQIKNSSVNQAWRPKIDQQAIGKSKHVKVIHNLGQEKSPPTLKRL